MNHISIFIDYANINADVFFEKLVNSLESIDQNISVLTYDDIDSLADHDDWEESTLNSIKSSDIVIPLLSSEYLQYISKPIEIELNKIIDSDDRYLFPVLMVQSDWSTHKWVVRSKLFPSGERSISDCTNDEKNQIVRELSKIIKNIIVKSSTDSVVLDNQGSEKLDNDSAIFISHDHDDADFAELLKLKLEKNGIGSWIDSEHLKIGQDWREEIDQGIENAMAVIAIMTPDARKSEYVTYEWAFAWGKGKKIFPIMLKQTQLHPRLESLQYMDFTNRSIRPWDDLIDIIKQTIK